MIKSILVAVTASKADPPVFDVALDVARRFEAHLDFLHVRLDPVEVAGTFSDPAVSVGAAELFERLDAEADERESSARKAVEAFCRNAGLAMSAEPRSDRSPSASWVCETGREAAWVAERGRTSDLLVVGRPSQGAGVGNEVLEAALLDTGRPLLIPAGTRALTGTVAIAWKSSPEAARAVTAANPFLAAAKRIVVLTVEEDGRAERESAARLVDNLRRQYPAVELRQLHSRGGTAEALLAAAAEHHAGLLVMGGYGRSRLREWIFGGVTADVLRGAAVPVLMTH